MSATDGTAPPPLLFTVVVPTRGDRARLLSLAQALAQQTLPRARWETIVVPDGVVLDAAVLARLADLGVRTSGTGARGGPGAARNAAPRPPAALARVHRGRRRPRPAGSSVPPPGSRPSPRSSARGLTVKPGAARCTGSRPTNRLPAHQPVRAAGSSASAATARTSSSPRRLLPRGHGPRLHARGGGSDVAREPQAVVTTRPSTALARSAALGAAARDGRAARRAPSRAVPRARRSAPPRPLRGAAPDRARERGVRARAGPALGSRLLGERAAPASARDRRAAFLPVWAKWRFDPLRLPVFLLVPFALARALARGALRRGAGRRPRARATPGPGAGRTPGSDTAARAPRPARRRARPTGPRSTRAPQPRRQPREAVARQQP